MDFSFDGQGALYEQLARALRRAILDGHFPPDSPLPPTRALAETLRISRNTVLGAYDLLCAEQLAIARRGSGTRVAHRGITAARAAAPALAAAAYAPATPGPTSRYAARVRRLGQLTLACAPPPGTRYNLFGEPLLPPRLLNVWRGKLAAAALRTDPGYPRAAGLPALRAAICDYLARRRGFVCAPRDILIVGGTRQALTLLSRVLLDEGDTAVIEDPHYELTLRALQAHGARVVSVGTDREGLITARLPAHAARLIYLTPSHQFPSGVVMSLARRVELLRVTQAHRSWILEDDYDSELQQRARPLPALRSLDGGERVIYVGTFSKSLFASLRLGFIVCPHGLRDDLLAAKHLDDGGCSAIDQAALAVFMQSRQFERHLHNSAIELDRRYEALVEGLERCCAGQVQLSGQRAGMHVIAWLPRLDYPRFARLLELAAARGLNLLPVHRYYRTPPEHPGLLVGFAGLSCAELRAATELLGDCLQELSRTTG